MWVVLLLLTLAALYRARSVGTPSPSYLHTATSVRRSSSRPQSERRAQRTQWTRRTFEQPALHSFIHSFMASCVLMTIVYAPRFETHHTRWRT